MSLNPMIREMLGDDLADAIDAARVRLANDTVIARCEAGQWRVEVDDIAVAEDLTCAEAIAATEALEPA